jgi:hypothetical protein
MRAKGMYSSRSRRQLDTAASTFFERLCGHAEYGEESEDVNA